MDGRIVGTLAETIDRRVAFAYSDEWLENGFAISPFSLPVEQKVFLPTGRVFEGMWGVFADSLPDAWGQLLVDRMLKNKGFAPSQVTNLERLAIVGESGMGALTYRPAWDVHEDAVLSDLDELPKGVRPFRTGKTSATWTISSKWAEAPAAHDRR
jgi:serine/threonine-protein kinase HipA